MSFGNAFSAAIGSQDSAALIMSGVLALVIAVFGYRLSQRIRATRGVTPWRIPSVVWALICFFFAPFGFALELIAIVSTRPESQKVGTVTQGTYVPETPDVAVPSEAMPSYAPRLPASGYAGPASDVVGSPAIFGWYEDVAGRHELRYWDGRDWTQYVVDAGTYTEDPIAPSRPGQAAPTTAPSEDGLNEDGLSEDGLGGNA